VMPCQVNGQFVAIKSQKAVHGTGSDAKAAAGGVAFIGITSAAQASEAHATPATPSIMTAEIPSFVI